MTNLHGRVDPDEAAIKGALLRLFNRRCTRRGRVDIVFTDDRRIAGLAGRFRKSHYATDVLAFNYAPVRPSIDDDIMGEIVISLDAAKRQAGERGVSLTSELILLALHGLLHLAGVGDETYRGWCRMRTLEFEMMMKIL